MGNGTFYVAAKPTTLAILQKAAVDTGVSFESAATAPTGTMAKLRKLRIGLVDHVGGGQPVGWTRLVFKNFEFPYVEDVNDVFAPEINAGNLHAKYDVLVFNNEGLGGGGGRGGGRGGGGANVAAAGGDTPPAGAAGATGAVAPPAGGRGGRGGGQAGVRAPGDDRPDPLPEPKKWADRRGNIDAAGQAALQQFVNDGGTVIAIGNAATSAIAQFKLPLADHAMVKPDGTPVQGTDYYVPGSVLRVAVDPKNPLAHGYGDQADIFFSNNPVWDLKPAAGAPVTHAVAWFANGEPLRSGWAWGQKYLDKGVEMAEATVGKGRVFVFGNELLFRSQPHGDFKFFFNALYLSVAEGLK
jgi:hypothetical protein